MNAALLPALGRFEWPTPPHFNRVEKPVIDGAEHGIVMMNDGRKLVGHMVRLDTGASVLEFQIEPERANLMIDFSAFKSLCLTRMVMLERVPLIVPSANVEANPIWKKQLCTVQFTDGSDLVSDAVGIVARKFGLYLFLAKGANQVQRWFIPMEAVASYQNGDLIGKILIDHKIVAAEVIDAGLEKQQRLRRTPLGEYLQQQHIVTSVQLEAALRRKEFVPHLKLGDVLVKEHVITERQRDDALAKQKTNRRKPLGAILVEMGVVTEDVIKPKIQARATVPELIQIAVAEGMLTMKQDGIEKILQGHTDLTEVQMACS